MFVCLRLSSYVYVLFYCFRACFCVCVNCLLLLPPFLVEVVFAFCGCVCCCLPPFLGVGVLLHVFSYVVLLLGFVYLCSCFLDKLVDLICFVCSVLGVVFYVCVCLC